MGKKDRSPPLGDALSPALRQKLLALRAELEKQGALILRQEKDRRGGWRIRLRLFDPELGYRKHRSISLGKDETVAYAAWAKIKQWRAEKDARDQAEEQRREAKRQEARENRRLRNIAQFVVPGSRAIRRQVGEDFDKAVKAGPLEALMFSFRLPGGYYPPRRGRPRKARLW